jgi:hypothetical protein
MDMNYGCSTLTNTLVLRELSCLSSFVSSHYHIPLPFSAAMASSGISSFGVNAFLAKHVLASSDDAYIILHTERMRGVPMYATSVLLDLNAEHGRRCLWNVPCNTLVVRRG